jgi:hypothetical protein
MSDVNVGSAVESFSLLMGGARGRFTVAALVVAALWLGVAWALA